VRVVCVCVCVCVCGKRQLSAAITQSGLERHFQKIRCSSTRRLFCHFSSRWQKEYNILNNVLNIIVIYKHIYIFIYDLFTFAHKCAINIVPLCLLLPVGGWSDRPTLRRTGKMNIRDYERKISH
jgi:hypothetical protein